VAVPELTDGVVRLDAFRLDDIPAHLAGEDEAVRCWLNDGLPSTVETVSVWAHRHLDDWAAGGGPRRMFAVRDATTGLLAGTVEANLESESCGLRPGAVNVSYQVLPQARGQGFAARAVTLMCGYLAGVSGVEVAVLQIDAGNKPSLRVAAAAGFEDVGWTVSPEGHRLRCFECVVSPPG
jgi:RimJ/RimL family protein N-acetyltransferase